MNDEIKTMKVKPWGKNQGDYVIINEDDFDPERHTPYGGTFRAGPVQDTPVKAGMADVPEETEPVHVAGKTKKKTRRKKKT